MTIKELKEECKNAKNVKISKYKNGIGNYSYQFYNGQKWIIGTFKTYDDAILFFLFEGFCAENHLQNSVILSKI